MRTSATKKLILDSRRRHRPEPPPCRQDLAGQDLPTTEDAMDALTHLPLVEPPPAGSMTRLIDLRERLLLHLHKADGGRCTKDQLTAIAGGADLARALDWYWFKHQRWSNAVSLTDAGRAAAIDLGF